MANFPNSVTSFAARSNGQTIDASHVQGLQDEVNAIEDGYLNATARLNSSNSTVANLSVTGGSTVAGLHVTSTASFDSSVTVTGNAQISGTLLVGGSPVGGIPIGAKVSIDSSVTVANSTAWTGVSWNTEIHDTGNLHSTASNSSRINLTSSGIWMFGAQIRWQDDSAGGSTCLIATRILANDTNVVGCEREYINDVSTALVSQMVTGTYYTGSTTDFLVCAVQRVGAGTIGLSSGTSTNDWGYSNFWAQRVS